MKILLKNLSAVILIFLIVSLFKLNAQSKKTETVVIKTTIYCDHCKICESCGGKLQKDLSFDKGIKLVTLDEKAMTVTVKYNPEKTNPENIRKKISMYGFDADDVKADSLAVTQLDECCQKK
jgi:hypothetical protein